MQRNYIFEQIDKLAHKYIDKDRPIPNILTPTQTIQMIAEKSLSVARYGDGEFSMMLKHSDTSFQKNNAELGKKLMETFIHPMANVLICIPKVFDWKDRILLNRTGRRFWSRYLKRQNDDFYSLMKLHPVYGDSRISRPYIDTLKIGYNYRKNTEYFEYVKKLWAQKDVLIVEGNLTRFGVGNSLLDNCRSIRRILCPAQECFNRYDEIKSSVLQINNVDLVLIALGPTATVLVNDLAKDDYGIQCIDIGHLDIEYEWFLHKAFRKAIVPGKFVNEVKGGNKVANDSFSQSVLQKYNKQVINIID